jgi:hypothetical protein
MMSDFIEAQMDRKREERTRDRATKAGEDAGKPDGQDRAHWAQSEREVASGRNPVSNGQGGRQADDLNNEMNSSNDRTKGDSRGHGNREHVQEKQKIVRELSRQP